MHFLINRTAAIFMLYCCCSSFLLQQSEALLRRCYQCRSRGDLGSCKDPFNFNATDAETEPGLAAIPCASGWCGKVREGGGSYAVDDYDLAVQRMCLQRGPDDDEDRCANTVYNYKSVFMCFCQGDLCNKSTRIEMNKFSVLAIFLVFVRIYISRSY